MIRLGQVAARLAREGRWIVPGLFALALGLRLALILLVPQQPFSDGAWYMERAAEMARGMGYQEAGFPTAFWPVGYPALLAAGMAVFGPGMAAPMLINLAAAALILWLILWFARHLGAGERAARIAGLLYAIYPAHIAYAGTPLSETASTAIIMAAFACLVGGRRKAWLLLAAGLLFGIGTLMRAQTLLFPIGAIVALLIVYREFRWRDAVKAGLIVHLAIAAVVVPWSMRNREVLGSFVLVSSNGGVALYTGANDQATGDWFPWEHGPLWDRTGIPFDQRIQRQVELDQRFKSLATDWIRANPGRFLALGPRKVMLLWSKDSDGFWGLQASYPEQAGLWTALEWINQGYYLLLLALALPCFAFGGLAVLRRREEECAPLALLACMPAFVSLIAFGFTGQVRYHYAAMPFVIVAAGWTLARVGARLRAHLRIRAAARLPKGSSDH